MSWIKKIKYEESDKALRQLYDQAKGSNNNIDNMLSAHSLRPHSKGLGDGEILEINQVVSYFNYTNRIVLGLGVNTKEDILGLSPNDSNDSANWSHP